VYLAICYTSSKNQSMSDEDLEQLIDKSIISNAKNEISGVLIEYQSNFLQYIEGPAVKVFELFHKIKLDKRHHSVLLIQEKEIPEININNDDIHNDNNEEEIIISEEDNVAEHELTMEELDAINEQLNDINV